MKACFVFVALALTACQNTTFEHPPVVETGCVPALAGDWLSQGVADESDGEVELSIDQQCHLEVLEHEQDGLRRGESTVLHGGKDREQGYLWVDAAWANQRFESKHAAPAGDVYVLRYRLDGNSLQMRLPDDKAIAHLIIDGKLQGEVQRNEDSLFNRILGPLPAGQLRRHDLFTGEVARFKRRLPEVPR